MSTRDLARLSGERGRPCPYQENITSMTEASARQPSPKREARAEAAAMPKAYRPADVEPAVYDRWLAADVFAPDGAGSRARPLLEPFVITMPPPNVTGALHLGHAARSATEDLMIRRARMQHRPTLWLPGVDPRLYRRAVGNAPHPRR